MFTGLVTSLGRVASSGEAGPVRRFRIEADLAPDRLAIGASVAHAGVCLTLTGFGPLGAGAWWTVDAVAETLSRTTLGAWREGVKVNIEPSLRLGDELGGHLVSGHVDAIGRLIRLTQEGEGRRLRFAAPAALAPLIAEKGSIAVDGVSLTVAAVSPSGGEQPWFDVAAIPHTLAVTTLGGLREGDPVNLEVDMLARYVARMLEGRTAR